MPFKNEPRMCEVEGCKNRAQFSIQIVMSTLARSPKGQLTSKTVALCDQCCSPKGGNWEAFKRAISFKAWALRTNMLHKLEEQPVSALPEDAQRVYAEQRGEPTDFKKCATQSEESRALPAPTVAHSGTAVKGEQLPSSPAVLDGKSAAAGAE